MSEAWRSAKVKSFEYVLAGSSDALLRVTAKPSRRHAGAGSLPRPMLLTDDGTSVNRYAPLPSPADERGLLRAAYSVHPRLISEQTVFSLFLDGGFAIMLPPPVAGAARVSVPESADPDDDDGEPGSAPVGIPPEAERRDDLSRKLTTLTRELAEARHEAGRHEARAGRHEQELARLRGGAAAVEREREELHQRLAAAEAQRAEAEAAQVTADERVRHATTEAEERLRAGWAQQVQTANDQAERAAAEVAAAQGQTTALEARIVQLQADLQAAQAETRRAMEQATAAGAAQQEALTTAEQMRTARLQAEEARELATRELVDMQDTLHRMTVEHDELTRQAGAFDGVAQKARERASEAETERNTAAGRLQELETWSGELERRLTEATDELTQLKSGAQAGDSEARRLRGELAESEAKVELMQAHIRALQGQPAADGASAPVVAAPDLAATPGPAAAADPAAPDPATAPIAADPALSEAPAQPSDELLRAIHDAAVAEAHDQAVADLAQLAGSGSR